MASVRLQSRQVLRNVRLVDVRAAALRALATPGEEWRPCYNDALRAGVMTQTKSRDVIIREDEFPTAARHGRGRDSGKIVAVLDDPALLESPLSSRGDQEAHGLETFLDDYGGPSESGVCHVRRNGCIVVDSLRSRAPRSTFDPAQRYRSLIDTAPLAAELERAKATLDQILGALMQGLQRESRASVRVARGGDYGSETLAQRRLLRGTGEGGVG